MKNIHKRFKQVRTTLQMNQQEFAEKLSVGQKTVSNMEMGRFETETGTALNNYIFRLLKEIPNLNAEWLKNGNGVIFKEPEPEFVTLSKDELLRQKDEEINFLKTLLLKQQSTQTSASVV